MAYNIPSLHYIYSVRVIGIINFTGKSNIYPDGFILLKAKNTAIDVYSLSDEQLWVTAKESRITHAHSKKHDYREPLHITTRPVITPTKIALPHWYLLVNSLY